MAASVIKKGDYKELVLKTLFVVAVAFSNRTAELATDSREDVNFRGDSMVLSLRPNFILKNQTQRHSPSIIKIPNLPGSRLCPNTAVMEYIEVTKHL